MLLLFPIKMDFNLRNFSATDDLLFSGISCLRRTNSPQGDNIEKRVSGFLGLFFCLIDSLFYHTEINVLI